MKPWGLRFFYAICFCVAGCGGQPSLPPNHTSPSKTDDHALLEGLRWIEGTDTIEISRPVRFLVGDDPIEVEAGRAADLGRLEQGLYWVSLDQPGYWAESDWLVIENGVAPRLRRRIYSLRETCATEYQACFTMDTTEQSKLKIGYRDIDSWHVWEHIERDEGMKTTELVKQVWFARDDREGGTTAGVDILVGPGTTEAQLELALALAARAKVLPSRIELKRFSDDNGARKEQPTVQLKYEIGEEAAALLSPLEAIRPRLEACYQGVKLTERLQVLLSFTESRAPSAVKVGTGLPQPPAPDCTEYEEDEGICSADSPPHPDFLVDAGLMECLRDNLRGLRTVPGTEPASYEIYLVTSDLTRDLTE